MPALARAGAIAQEPASAKADGIFGVIGCGGDDVESLVNGPRSCEEAGMGLAGLDDAFELGVGQQAVRDEVRQ